MDPVSIGLGLAGFAKSWWKAVVGAVLVAGPIFLLGSCHGGHVATDRWQKAQAEAEAASVKRNAAAQQKAAEEKAADVKAVQTQSQELINAVATLPDAVPDARRVALACQRLRNQGVDVSRVPSCIRPPGGAQATAPR